MLVNSFVKICYEIAKEKGFYSSETAVESHVSGLISELYETYQAHRNNLFTDRKEYISQWFKNPNSKAAPWRILYSKKVKNNFEDEITDLFIRVFNLSAFMGVNINYNIEATNSLNDLDFDQQILFFNKLFLKYNDMGLKLWFSLVIGALLNLCEIYNIPIIQHINAKIEYNKSRSYLHGKNY